MYSPHRPLNMPSSTANSYEKIGLKGGWMTITHTIIIQRRLNVYLNNKYP